MRGAHDFFRQLLVKTEALSRARFQLRFQKVGRGGQRVYFLCPDHNRPSGGIRVIYRHVDLLNEAGISSAVLHHKPGFRCDWFANKSVISYLSTTILCGADLLVVPEVDCDYLRRIPEGLPFIIFNQNAHLTWQRISGLELEHEATRRNMLGFLTVSKHNQSMLKFAYPRTYVSRIHLGIDERIFNANHVGQRPHRIGYMPRRRKDDARQVLEALSARRLLRNWQVVALDGLAHERVAEELRTCRIFLAFADQEGFGLPAAEAMACGAYVIGNHGFAGKEFFHHEFSKSVGHGDVYAFVRAVEEAVLLENDDDCWCAARGLMASSFVLDRYSRIRETTDVVEYYRALTTRIRECDREGA